MESGIPSQRYGAYGARRRVYISSTREDLRAHREKVHEVVERMDQVAVITDYAWAWAGGDATIAATDDVADADAYIAIVAWRYGPIPEGQTRSVTHLEYAEATRLGRPRFVFLADSLTEAPDGPDAIFPAETRDLEHHDQLLAFRAELEREHAVDYFMGPEDLAVRVAAALAHYLRQAEQPVPSEPTAGPRVPHDLPPRAPEFVGRVGELRALYDMLYRGQSEGISAAVAGVAGVGKSALAAEVVHTLAADPSAFPGGTTWMRCDGRTGLAGLAWVYDQLLGAWGVALGAEELGRAATPEAEVALRERALRTRLWPASRVSASAPALALLDNVEWNLPIARALDTLAALGIAVLFTARHEPTWPQLRLARLDVLDPGSAAMLFVERYVERGGEWDPARDGPPAQEVVEAQGRLPLAIELAAARAARTQAGAVALAGEPQHFGTLAKLHDPLDPTGHVRYACGKTLALLSPAQRVRFAALGLPDGPDWPRPVVESMLEAVADYAPEAAPAGDDLDLLAALSLAKLSASEPLGASGVSASRISAPRVRMHPVLRELAREEWARQPTATQTAGLAGLLAGVGALIEERKDDFAALAREEDLIAETLRRAAQEHVAPRPLSAAIDMLGDYLYLGGHWRLGMELYGLQLDARREAGDRAGEGIALGNLGTLADSLSRADEAERYFEQALAVLDAVGAADAARDIRGRLGELAQERFVTRPLPALDQTDDGEPLQAQEPDISFVQSAVAAAIEFPTGEVDRLVSASQSFDALAAPATDTSEGERPPLADEAETVEHPAEVDATNDEAVTLAAETREAVDPVAGSDDGLVWAVDTEEILQSAEPAQAEAAEPKTTERPIGEPVAPAFGEGAASTPLENPTGEPTVPAVAATPPGQAPAPADVSPPLYWPVGHYGAAGAPAEPARARRRWWPWGR
jgi:tetratricopeptide (TPR) repeat protein